MHIFTRICFDTHRLSEDQEISSLDQPENSHTVDKAMDQVYREYKRQLSQGTTSLNDEVTNASLHLIQTFKQ